MQSFTTLSATNTSKTQELDEALSIALRDAISNHDKLEISTFESDEIKLLAAVVKRVACVVKARDMTIWMEDEDDGKQNSAWDIFFSILDRAVLGYEDEEKVNSFINAATLYRNASR